MDLLTHALLGTTTAALVSPGSRRWCAAAGGLAALAPDLDMLIRSSADPLLALQFHRHFTHSLIFAPLGALFVALVLWLPLRRRLEFPQLYIGCLVGYTSACLLDACTSYGTHLFWPWQSAPIALSIIAVVDPVMTLLLLTGLLLDWRLRYPALRYLGLALAGSYLLVGYVQQQRALSEAEKIAAEYGLAPHRILAKPTLANLLLWRTIIVADGQAIVNAIRVGISADAKVYPGERITLVDPHNQSLVPQDSRAGRDLQRFYRFADGLLVADPTEPHMLGDLRYALLPNSVRPLWGILVNPQAPQQAPLFVTRRNTSPEQRRAFTAMLMGDDLPDFAD